MDGQTTQPEQAGFLAGELTVQFLGEAGLESAGGAGDAGGRIPYTFHGVCNTYYRGCTRLWHCGWTRNWVCL